jgi:hypothetical protein
MGVLARFDQTHTPVVGQFEKTFPQGLKPALVFGCLRHG